MGIESIFRPAPWPDEGSPRTLASYSLLWPEMLHQYYLHTGDADYARPVAEFALPELDAFFVEATSADGLLDPGRMPACPPEVLAGFSPEAAAAPVAILNMFYFQFLSTSSILASELGLPSAEFAANAEKLRIAIDTSLWDERIGRYRDAPALESHSALTNALALDFGLATDKRQTEIIELLRREGAACPDRFRPYVIESCFRAQEFHLAWDLLKTATGEVSDTSALYLIPEQIAGLGPAGFGWHGVQAAPRFVPDLDALSLSVPFSQGRITMHYAKNTGARILLPPGVGAWIEAGMGVPIMIRNEISHGRGELSARHLEILLNNDWSGRVGSELGVWVSVAEQMLRLVQNGRVVYQARCASAAQGVGSDANSLKTPLGWHSIRDRVGKDAVRGQVFRSRRPTREVWQPGEQPAEDLVLTRILLLDGLEPGLNKGGAVDSYARNIYIHGTNDEARLGTPSSHGCIRLSNDDVVEVFDLVPQGTPVLITEE